MVNLSLVAPLSYPPAAGTRRGGGDAPSGRHGSPPAFETQVLLILSQHHKVVLPNPHDTPLLAVSSPATPSGAQQRLCVTSCISTLPWACLGPASSLLPLPSPPEGDNAAHPRRSICHSNQGHPVRDFRSSGVLYPSTKSLYSRPNLSCEVNRKGRREVGSHGASVMHSRSALSRSRLLRRTKGGKLKQKETKKISLVGMYNG